MIASPTSLDLVPLFGITFNNVDFEQVCELIEERIQSRVPGFITTPNVDHIVKLHRDPAFLESYAKAWLILVDGTPVVWMSRILGKPLKQKLSGSDLVPMLSEWAARKGYSIYLFGGPKGAAEESGQKLQQEFPGLRVAGTQCPAWGFHLDPAANADAVAHVRAAAPDICFVGLGAPKQERWMVENMEACGVPVMLGIGGSFDFVSGRIRRAPYWMQQYGLEWFWRLCQEPKRLWRRYLLEDPYIFVLFFRELLARFRSRGTQTA